MNVVQLNDYRPEPKVHAILEPGEIADNVTSELMICLEECGVNTDKFDDQITTIHEQVLDILEDHFQTLD